MHLKPKINTDSVALYHTLWKRDVKLITVDVQEKARNRGGEVRQRWWRAVLKELYEMCLH